MAWLSLLSRNRDGNHSLIRPKPLSLRRKCPEKLWPLLRALRMRPNGRARTKQGPAMFTMDCCQVEFSRVPKPSGALAIGAVAFSASATATPLPLFPFIMTKPLPIGAAAGEARAFPKTKAPWSRCRRG